MSQAFNPITLDKTSLREAAALIVRALLSNPVALTLGLLFMFGAILVTNKIAEPALVDGAGNFATGVVFAFAAFSLIQAPSILAAYLLFKTAYRDTVSGFLANLIATRYHIHLAGFLLFYLVAFFFIQFLFQPADTASEPIGEAPRWLAMIVSMVFLTAVLWFLTAHGAQEVIHIRTGFNSKQVDHYWSMTKRRNKRAYPISILLNSGFQFVILLWLSNGSLSLLLLLFCQTVSAMLWAYVMFSSTFPPKEKVKETVLVQANQPQ